MIYKEAGELLAKLNSLKTHDSGQHKRLKDIAKNIIEYQSRIKKWLLQFDVKISEVQTELKTLREQQIKEEEEKVKEIEHFQVSLRKLLDSYSKEARNANERLSSMVQSIKQEMRGEFKQSLQKQKGMIERYKTMSSKLQSLIELVRSQQKKSIEDHEGIKQLIRIHSNQINEQRQSFLQESSLRNKEMAQNLSRLETKVNVQLQKFMGRLDTKIYENSKAINYMVQEATNL